MSSIKGKEKGKRKNEVEFLRNSSVFKIINKAF